MATQAKLAHGTQLQRIGVSILEVTKIGDFEIEAGEVEATNTDSLGWEETIPGLLKAKDLQIEGNLRLDDTTGQMQLAADAVAKTISQFAVVGPATLPFSWTFNGWVKSFATVQPVAEDKPAQFKATIKVTGSTALVYSMSTDLTGLVITTGTLAPALTASLYDYGSALGAVTSVTITATKAAATLKLYVNDVFVQNLTSGSPSSAIATPVGTTKVVISTQDAGKVPRNYKLGLFRTS